MEKLKIQENKETLALFNENGEEAVSKANKYKIEKVTLVEVFSPTKEKLWSGRVIVSSTIEQVLSKIDVSYVNLLL